MESYGAILKQAREAKKINQETASREASISREYIEALETENTSIFHGEAYLVGFLRNYSEYLNLDSNYIIKLYHNLKIQESAVPEELIKKINPIPKVPVIIASVIFALVLTFVILYFTIYRPQQLAKQNAYAISERLQPKTYEITDKPLNERVYVGDQFLIPTNSGNIVLTVVSDTNSKLQLNTPMGMQYFELSETRELDIDGDSDTDIVIDVWEISSNEKSRGAEIYIMKTSGADIVAVDNTSIPLSTASATAEQKIILEDNRAYPFTMNASFRNPCVFRYDVDRKESIENYYANGDVVTMTANNRVRVWISNGNTVKFQVVAASQTFELEIARAGEVVVQDIKWVRTEDGKYRLVVESID